MKKIGVVESGGGSRGRFQTEVKDFLLQKGLNIHSMSGNSVGVLNASMTATGQFEELKYIWKHIENKDVYSGKVNAFGALRGLFTGSMLDNTPLKKMIEEKLIDKNVYIPFSYGVTDIENLEYFQFTKRKGLRITETDSILASTSFPPLWKPVPVRVYTNGKVREIRGIDGGLVHHKPVGDLPGFHDLDEILVITTDTEGSTYSKSGFISDTLRMVEASIYLNMQRDIEQVENKNGDVKYKDIPIKVVRPFIKLRNMFDFEDDSDIGHGYRVAKGLYDEGYFDSILR